ncbi:MAG TPA: NHL repeat-containing protein [Solirubrobacteraceae bacterium]
MTTWDGSNTPAGSFGLNSLGVAANNSTGQVYVAENRDNVVDRFDAIGAYQCQITGAGSATTSASECSSSALGVPGGFVRAVPLAVDQATDRVYVVDTEAGAVDIFDAAGNYLSQLTGFSTSVQSVAVDDATGHVFVADSGTHLVYQYDSGGVLLSTWNGANTPTGSFGGDSLNIAANNGSGDVYVSDSGAAVVDQFDASGNYLGQIAGSPSGAFVEPRGVAVDQVTGEVYVVDSGHGQVDIFAGTSVVVPDVSTGVASEVHATSATLHGILNPETIKPTDCHFDYGTTTAYGQTAPCVPAAGAIPPDSSEHSVSASIGGLIPGTTYHFRLAAANDNDEAEPNLGSDATLETSPTPLIDSTTTTNVTTNSADLNVNVNPSGLETTCRFELGTNTGYGQTYPCTPQPGSGASAVSISQHVEGLSANTTYHWRVVAHNGNGITTGADHTFIYSTSATSLPDDRAYEMVTPPQKNGALIGQFLVSVPPDIADDGSRVMAPGIQCFAGAESCNANRGRVGSPYMFARTVDGWVTTPLVPSATRYNADTPLAVSASAGTSLFSMPTAPFGEDDFYVRQSTGSFLDLGPSSPPSAGAQGAGPANEGQGVAATADMSHMVYSPSKHEYRWPVDSTIGARTSLEEYTGAGNTEPELVGVRGGRGSTELISRCGTILGDGLENRFNALSASGRVVYFTATQGSCGASGPSVDELYARVDGARTVAISEPAPSECGGGSQPAEERCRNAPRSAGTFLGASEDGSKAFFLSGQQLTDEASANGNLYLYNLGASEGHNLADISSGDKSGLGPRVLGVMAISSDGSHVYFVAKGVLTEAPNAQGQGARSGANNLYVYERDTDHPDGQVVFVAAVPSSDAEEWALVGALANVTPDGRYLVFTSHGALTPDDLRPEGPAQVFRYDAQTKALQRLSIGNGGFKDSGNAGVGDASIVVPSQTSFDRAGAARTDPTMSNDGSFVFFSSPIGLTPQALNDVQIATDAYGVPQYARNIYEYHDGHVSLISDGRDTTRIDTASTVILIGSDTTGANVFFSTADPLVPQDTDTQSDIYDARICTVNGPCIAQPSPPLPPCLGEACHGTPAGTPLVPDAPTVTFNGQGSLVSAQATTVKSKKVGRPSRCSKGKRRRHGKCVKARNPKTKRAKSHKGGK